MWCMDWDCYVNVKNISAVQTDADRWDSVWTDDWGYVNALIPAKRQRTEGPDGDQPGGDSPNPGTAPGKGGAPWASPGKSKGKGKKGRGKGKGGPCWTCGGAHFAR